MWAWERFRVTEFSSFLPVSSTLRAVNSEVLLEENPINFCCVLSLIPLLVLERSCGAMCCKRLQAVQWARQRGLLLTITHEGGQCREMRNKLWGRAFSWHLGLTEVRDQLLSSQMELGFGGWMDLFVQNQNAAYLRRLQNRSSIMVVLWSKTCELQRQFLFLAVIYNYWYREHQGNSRVYGESFTPASWQQQHLFFERKAGSESLESWCLSSCVELGQGILVSRITVI